MVAAIAASATNRGCRVSGASHSCTGTGVGIRSPRGPRSTNTTTAGSTSNSAAQQSRMPPPAIMPSSATPTKLVSAAQKKATAVVIAPVRMPGPTRALASSRASSQESPRRRISRYRPM